MKTIHSTNWSASPSDLALCGRGLTTSAGRRLRRRGGDCETSATTSSPRLLQCRPGEHVDSGAPHLVRSRDRQGQRRCASCVRLRLARRCSSRGITVRRAHNLCWHPWNATPVAGNCGGCGEHPNKHAWPSRRPLCRSCASARLVQNVWWWPLEPGRGSDRFLALLRIAVVYGSFAAEIFGESSQLGRMPATCRRGDPLLQTSNLCRPASNFDSGLLCAIPSVGVDRLLVLGARMQTPICARTLQ